MGLKGRQRALLIPLLNPQSYLLFDAARSLRSGPQIFSTKSNYPYRHFPVIETGNLSCS